MKFRTLSAVSLAAFLMACGSDGAQGPEGPPGPPGANGTNGADVTTPSANAISPASGFLGRELDVQVGFSGGELTGTPTVDFGKGVTVSDVKVASPTLLTVHVSIAKDAEIGAHDVKVNDLVAKGAFKVAPSLKVTEAIKAEQGGLGGYLIDNLDSYIFDTADGAFAITAGTDLVTFSASASGAYAAQSIFLIPPSTPAGSRQLAAHNLDATGAPAISFYGESDTVKIATRAPESFTFGTPKAGLSFASAYGSKLYSFASTANENALLVLNMHVDADELTSLIGVLWNAGGTAKDRAGILKSVETVGPYELPLEPPYDINFTLPVTGASRSFFLSILETSGEKGTKFDFAPTSVAATVVAEGATAHDTQATAQAFTAADVGSGNILTGEITDDKSDWYKFTVAADEIVEVSIDSGAANLEVALRNASQELAYASGGKGMVSSGKSEVLPAGDYFLKAGPGEGQTTSLTGKYTVGLRRIAKN